MNPVRKSRLFFFCLLVQAGLFALMVAHAAYRQHADRGVWAQRAALVARLGLTDLALFTDARYTRHPTMADRHTPFQDYPLSLEHFPSGSILTVPPHLKPPSRK